MQKEHPPNESETAYIRTDETYIRSSKMIGGGGGSCCGPIACCLFLCCCVLPAVAIGIAYYYANQALQNNGDGSSLSDYMNGDANWEDIVDNMDDGTISQYTDKFSGADDDTIAGYISQYMGGNNGERYLRLR